MPINIEQVIYELPTWPVEDEDGNFLPTQDELRYAVDKEFGNAQES